MAPVDAFIANAPATDCEMMLYVKSSPSSFLSTPEFSSFISYTSVPLGVFSSIVIVALAISGPVQVSMVAVTDNLDDDSQPLTVWLA
jgi:hypothetical protein